ncbi:MAG: hypothetical protein IPN76_09490 [Saprospiraceae bacterium]|nr:hypothetical protein [Saprospiraceae bacterium]
MQSSSLNQLISSFSTLELREVRKFLTSPFFNTRSDLVILFDSLTTMGSLEKTEVWQRLNPSQPFDDQKLRLLMSYLHRLLEQYLAFKEATANELSNRLNLAKAYRNRGMMTAFERTSASHEKIMAENPMLDAQMHHHRYQVHWEKYQVATAQNPAADLPIHQLTTALDAYYVSLRLRLICFAIAQKSVYRSDNQLFMEEEVLMLAGHENLRNEVAVAIYLHCYKMLKRPNEEEHFQAFKQLLLGASGQFNAEDIQGLYIFAINYCVRRLNDGQKAYFQEVFELYKSGLATNHLLENNVLSRFTYHNIVAAGLQTGNLDWVQGFIHEYKNTLERSYRESSFSFSLARLEFARRRYDAVLELLQKANYRDPLLNLAAKTLLLKTWYELGEHDLLQSHLDAMRNYIHRKRVIGYHRTNYLNIVRFADKLLNINWNSRKEVEALKSEMEREEVLTEKEWLLGQILL